VGEYEAAAKNFQPTDRCISAIVDSHVAMGDLPGALAAATRVRPPCRPNRDYSSREADILRRNGDRAAAARARKSRGDGAIRSARESAARRVVPRPRSRGRAVRLLREAVALDPGTASYWNSLGMVLGGAERLAEAERAFAEAAQRDSNNAQYAYNRGVALQRLGRASDAEPSFRRAAALGFGPARERLAELRATTRR